MAYCRVAVADFRVVFPGAGLVVQQSRNTDHIDPIPPLGNLLPQMNANQCKWVEIDSPLPTVPDRFALICG
ncbi:MAG: hypothetical protein [Olavius algarvensis Gamma 1 endosymbiont]|nr:MAG: hypothetical protein [Olavius algarvensis Gamma 1 endosymbiont]